MSDTAYTIVVWADDDMPVDDEFLMIERDDGGVVCVLRESCAGDPGTLADLWAAYRLLARPRWSSAHRRTA